MTGNIPSSSKGRTGEETVIEDVEDDVDELPDSDFPNPPREYLIKYIMGRMVSSIVKGF